MHISYMLIISQKNFFDSLSASSLNLKMTSRGNWNVTLSCPHCFSLVFLLINTTFLNRFGPKELQGSLTAAFLGFNFRWEINLYIRAPFLSIIKSCITLSMWNNSLGHMTVATSYHQYFSLSLPLLYHESRN